MGDLAALLHKWRLGCYYDKGPKGGCMADHDAIADGLRAAGVQMTGDAGLREAAQRASEFLDHLAEYETRHLSHVDCGGEPGSHAPVAVEADALRAALEPKR